MARPENDKWLDEALSDAIGSKEIRTDFEQWKQTHPQAVHTLTSRANRQTSVAVRPFGLRNTIMKSPLTKLVAAALVAIACLIGLSLWRTTGSGIALADVLARIEKVKFLKFQMSSKVTGDPNYPNNLEMRHVSLTSQEYGYKYSIELLNPNGEWNKLSESYFSPQKKTEILIFPTEKIYLCQELADTQVEKMQQEGNTARDPLRFLRGMLESKYETLGGSTIDGVEVTGFRSTDPNWFINMGKNQQVDYRIWVDVKTQLPVRYDILASAEVDETGDRQTHHVVFYDFQWDVPIDAAEFAPPMLDGYTIKVVKLPPDNEETAIQGLKLLVELLDRYPENIIDSPPRRHLDETALELVEKSETPVAMQLKQELKGLTEDGITIKRVVFLMPIRGVERFYFLLVQDKKDPAYFGKIVTPKDADKVLMRWKVSDSEYRVIYGDLRAETVTKEKLAELEAALPK